MIAVIRVTTTGAGGAATGEATMDPGKLLQGANRTAFLWSLHVDYNAAAPGTTDLVVKEVGGLGRTLLTLTNKNTDGVYYPRFTVHKADGTDRDTAEAAVLEGPLKVEVAQCDALDPAVVVTAQLVVSRAAD